MKQPPNPRPALGEASCYALIVSEYAVVVEREEEGGFSVWVPDLPGCASMGDTYDEALENIREAIEGYIAAHRAEGLPLPEPRTRIDKVSVAAA